MKQILLLLLLWGVVGYVNAEVLVLESHGFVVENKVETDASASQTWDALVNDIGDWWPRNHTWWGEEGSLSIDATAGGCFCETAQNRSAAHMLISFVEPGVRLRMTGGLGPLQGMGVYGALDWIMTTTPRGTEILLRYRVHGLNENGFEKLAPVVDAVQGQQLDRLRLFLEGHRAG